jgi:hypothetical protein
VGDINFVSSDLDQQPKAIIGKSYECYLNNNKDGKQFFTVTEERLKQKIEKVLLEQ